MSHDRSHGDSVADAYDRWAGTYDTDANATRDLAALVVREIAAEADGMEVLEIGCGTGLRTAVLAGRARSILALDASEGMLQRARAHVSSPTVEFRRHDLGRKWPRPDASVDLVLDVLVLEHIHDLEEIFREAARVLRAGGRCFVCELHPARQWRGGQAHFRTGAGEEVRVPAVLHDTSEYVNAGIRAGLELRAMGERRDPGAAPSALPRLLLLDFRRAPDAG